MKDVLYPLRVLHGQLHEWRENELPYYWERFRHPGAVYLVLTPAHDNLGDHAIAYAEARMLKDLGVPYIEVSDDEINSWFRKNCLHVMNGRPILIHGGGNIGSLYPFYEQRMRSIVQKNPRSRILFMPNTMFYGDTEANQKQRLESIELYNRHEGLKLYARESISYEMMKSAYRNVGIAPDMVMYLNQCREGVSRSGCILCLRKDKERTRSAQVDDQIDEQVKRLFGTNVRNLDMVSPKRISLPEREAELEKQFDAFRHAQLVITDRLHGMIFCAITGTPCIVVNSKSHKVRGCYQWIKDLPYIRFCEDAAQIEDLYRSIPQREWQYDNSKVLPEYDSLKKDILAAYKR